VAHHANKCPEYFCSRPEKHVHLYKKALAFEVPKKPDEVDDEVDSDTAPEADAARAKKLATKPSDLELYERRCAYTFPEGTPLSTRLPDADTPVDQVAAARIYDFFRFVQYHGGKWPHFTWHPEDNLPVVIMSPVVKLREGPISPLARGGH
jgi:hypothetical protein